MLHCAQKHDFILKNDFCDVKNCQEFGGRGIEELKLMHKCSLFAFSSISAEYLQKI